MQFDEATLHHGGIELRRGLMPPGRRDGGEHIDTRNIAPVTPYGDAARRRGADRFRICPMLHGHRTGGEQFSPPAVAPTVQYG